LVGRSRLLRANTAHRVFEPLARLVLVTFGPHVVVAEEFASLPGTTHVVIYGSWAARYAGIDRPAPADVDVLVVGNPARAEVYTAAERAEVHLGMPVNPTVRASGRWVGDDDPTVATIQGGAHLDVTADELSPADRPAPRASPTASPDTVPG
jgi:hypothetical protein